ncbi:hypothetical protein ACWCQN_32285 [Streptomyces sp. NPDC001984]
MTAEGGRRRRRMWHGLAVGWAVAVAVGGGLTLWLQDSTEPSGPYVWQDAGDDSPPPPQQQLGREGHGECPQPSRPPGEPPMLVLCAYSTHR